MRFFIISRKWCKTIEKYYYDTFTVEIMYKPYSLYGKKRWQYQKKQMLSFSAKRIVKLGNRLTAGQLSYYPNINGYSNICFPSTYVLKVVSASAARGCYLFVVVRL